VRRAGGVAIALLTGCASSYQSARVLAPGKTEVTVGVTRGEFLRDEAMTRLPGNRVSTWTGDLQLRRGLFERFDGGVRLSRMPGTGESVSLLGVDLKAALTAPDAKLAFSVALPISVGWAEYGGTLFYDGTIIVAPSFFAGFALSPCVELVIAPKLFMLLPDGEFEEREIEVGGSLGVRYGSASGGWAVHPEIGFMHLSEDDRTQDLITFGLGISAAR
jgi:hypothetical protein